MSNEKAIWAQEGNHTMATLHCCASEGLARGIYYLRCEGQSKKVVIE